MSNRYVLVCVGLVALAAAATLLAYPHLPARIPIHWNAAGRIDGYGPPWMLFVLGPGIMALITLLFASLPWLSPQKFEVESFGRTYRYLTVLFVALFGYLNALLLLAALGLQVDTARAILGGISVLVVLIGNVMGKVRRNFFIGIRTPWALASEQVWYATHRFAAWAMVATGVASLGVVALSGPLWAWMGLILAGALAPAAYSLVFYKSLARAGEL